MAAASKILCLCSCDYDLISEYKTDVDNRLPRLVQCSNKAPRLFVFYGHGTDSEMIGQDRKPIIDLDNAHLLKGWVVYAMACNTVNILGPAIIEAGGVAYIGFSEHFKFIPYTHEVFGKCVNNVIEEILNGISLSDAIKSARDRFDYYIEEYKERCSKTDDPQLKSIFEKTFKLLTHDKSALTLLGDTGVILK